MAGLQIDIRSTALVLIDLQRGIVSRQTAPYSSAGVVAVVFAEDATAGMAAEAHEFAAKTIFPRLGLVRTTEQILGAISAR